MISSRFQTSSSNQQMFIDFPQDRPGEGKSFFPFSCDREIVMIVIPSSGVIHQNQQQPLTKAFVHGLWLESQVGSNIWVGCLRVFFWHFEQTINANYSNAECRNAH